jgi:hypothetical protein
LQILLQWATDARGRTTRADHETHNRQS